MHLQITYKANKIKLMAYELTKYINNNHPRNIEDYKSMMKYCFFINKVVVFWYSKK